MRSQIPLFNIVGGDGRTFTGRPWCMPDGDGSADVDGSIMLERDDGTPFAPFDADEVKPLTAAAREVMRWSMNVMEFEGVLS